MNNNNNKFLFFNEDELKDLNNIFTDDLKYIYIYSCKFLIKYKNKFGTVQKSSKLITDFEINSEIDKNEASKLFVKRNEEIEKASLIQFILVDKKENVNFNIEL